MIIRYFRLSDAQQRHFSALYRIWNARGFDWRVRQSEPTFVQKVSVALAVVVDAGKRVQKVLKHARCRPSLA